MPRVIYLLYSCNAWKNWDSMSLIMASTSQRKVRKEVRQRVENGNMEYDADPKDLVSESLDEIEKYLKYGYIDIVIDGEVQ